MKHTALSVAAATVVLLNGVQAAAVPVNDTEPYTIWTKNSAIGAPVNTTSGMLVGHASREFPAVSEYLGIPYAKPPLNDLRFAPPQAYKSNGSTIIASKLPLSCVQDTTPAVYNTSNSAQFNNIQQSDSSYKANVSEDCLYMNVWTKYPYPGTPLKPVMVWIYGGGFHAGGSSDDSQQGSIFAEEQDVVAVSFNYRLNVFGFSGAPGLQDNVGILDQRLAVEWVRDNIEAFGGDPNRIVLYGHSAGSQSVDLYNYAWTDDPIISGSIIMSGTASSGHRTLGTAALAWSTISQLLGCGSANTTSADKMLSCVRSKPATAVFNASAQANGIVGKSLSDPRQAGQEMIEGAFGPTTDNITVFSNYTARDVAGQFIRRPILTGVNDDEGCFWVEGRRVPPAEGPVISDSNFVCPGLRIAKARAAFNVPTWRYRYFGAYPNVYANVCPGQPWHGQEVYVMFGSTKRASGFNATRKELEMGFYFRDAWSKFAHHPEKGLTYGMGWPMFQANESNVVALGLNETVMSYIDASAYDAVCSTTYKAPSPNY